MSEADKETLVQQILGYICAIKFDESTQYVNDQHPSVYLDERKRLIFSNEGYTEYIEPWSGNIFTPNRKGDLFPVYDNTEYLRTKPIGYLKQVSKRLEKIIEEIQLRHRPRLYLDLASRSG